MALLLDLILLIILLAFTLLGYSLGIFQALGAILGLIFASLIAGPSHKPLGNFLKPLFLDYCNLAKIIIFSIILILITKTIGSFFYLIGKKYQLTRLPFLKNINRIGGLVLGFFEGVIVMGLILFVTSHYLSNYEWISKILTNSKITNWLIKIVEFLEPLLPKF